MSAQKLYTLDELARAAGVKYGAAHRAASLGKIPVSYSSANGSTKDGAKVRRMFTPEDFAKAVEILKPDEVAEEPEPKSAAPAVSLAPILENQLACREELEVQLNALATLTSEVRELRRDLQAAWEMRQQRRKSWRKMKTSSLSRASR